MDGRWRTYPPTPETFDGRAFRPDADTAEKGQKKWNTEK